MGHDLSCALIYCYLGAETQRDSVVVRRVVNAFIVPRAHLDVGAAPTF